MEDFGRQVRKLEVDVVLVGADTATFTDLNGLLSKASSQSVCRHTDLHREPHH